MCRQEIPADFIERPNLVDLDESKGVPVVEEEYQWFYEGRNGNVTTSLFILYLKILQNISLTRIITRTSTIIG